MNKRGFSFIFVFIFTIFLIGLVSSASCSITTSCSSNNIVMRLSSSTNAHGALWDGTYGSYLCCDFTGTHSCDGSNSVVILSSSTNAHAEVPSLTNYPNDVCFGNLTCTSTTSSSCPSDYSISMVSLSSSTNAHIAQFSSYGTKICCAFETAAAACGNGAVEGTETCDDGNIINGDGCSAACAIESGYNCNSASPTCCYRTNPQTDWSLNGEYAEGEIKQGDLLEMIISDDMCLASGTSVTFTIYEGATSRATATGTVVSGSPGHISATYTTASSFLTALEEVSDIFFRTTNPITVTSSTISVTPMYCGDGVCTSANGENCLSCATDCGCGTGYECSSGSCTALCDLTSATWNITSSVTGQPVKLNVAGTNCAGKTISFTIWEKDGALNADDAATPNPSNIVFSGTSSYSTWASVFQDDTDLSQSNPPEYYFTASVVGYSESITSSNTAVDDALMLRVTEPVTCGNGVCNPSENCSTCLADCGCGTGYVCSSGGSCVLECVLTGKSWNVSSAVDGQQVQLTVTGTNCNGNSVSFQVLEYDALGTDDAVEVNPSPISATMTSGQATTRWFAEWPGYGDSETSPEYYFIPTISTLGKTLTDKTPRISVTQNLYCGDSIITSPETCDDGDATSGDGCSSACTIESGYSCTGAPSVCTLICGNGVINSPEECDGTNLNGATCVSELGTGWTGTPTCNTGCTLNTSTCIAPPVCSISSAVWDTAIIEEGNQVQLMIQTANCNNGETISFVVKEDDAGTDDDVTTNPSTVSVVSNSATGIWVAEWQDDYGGIFSSEVNPPEYYFTATVLSNGRNLQSAIPNLNVTQRLDAQCSGIGYCAGYTTKASCEADACDVGVNSVPGIVSCGGIFNSETGCYDYTLCGCAWDNSSNECGPSWDEESSCGECGNGIRDYPNERCDDGNTINGDGCSSTCNFEDNIDAPCPLGLSLCNDGTCSLNCYSTDEGVSACNYDNVCQSNEGCTCADCNSEEDTCEEGLVCSIFNAACCNFIIDNECNPYCSYVDPDCAGACGNGFKETGEECDLGIMNDVTNSGCSGNCKLQIINNTDGCPEGTALCTDGTCSLNCYATDEGVDDSDFTQCQTDLIWSIVDQACCNNVEDSYCIQYCAFSDPDCVSQSSIDGAFPIGTCSYTETSQDTCEDDNMLVRSLAALWSWDTDNTFATNPDPSSSDYWQPLSSGVYRYDPLDYSGLRKSEKCDNVEDTLVCPASVQVAFFGILSFVIAVIIIVIIYIIFSHKGKKKNSKSKRKK